MKHLFKKVFTPLIAFLLIACFAFTFAACDNIDKGASAGLSYELLEAKDGYAVTGIGSFTGEDLILTENYNGLPVKEVKNGAFSGKTELQSVKIPNSIKSIGESAFAGCTGLEKFEFLGSIIDWQKIQKAEGWKSGTPFNKLLCAEGTLDLNKTYTLKNNKIYEMVSDKTIELFQDSELLTGLSVGSTVMNDAGIYGRLDYGGTAESLAYYNYLKLSQWHANPSIIDLTTHELNGTYTVDGDIHTYKNDCKVIRVDKSKKEVYLELDSSKVEASSGSTTSDHPHHLIEKEFAYSPKFGELSELKLSFNFNVEKFENYGAYSGGQAAQCSWYFYLANEDNSESMFFGFNVFDDRWDFYGNNPAEAGDYVGWEENANNAVLKMARSRWADFTRVSVGTTYNVEIDVLELLDEGIANLKNKYSQYSVNKDDLRIYSFNFGWEMPNIKSVNGIAISDMSVLATYK